MSRYLIDRIKSLPNVIVHPNSEIGTLEADDSGLSSVGLKKPLPDGTNHFDTRHLFLFTGADPNTEWLRTCGVELDEKGFVLTGNGADGMSACDLATTVEGRLRDRRCACRIDQARGGGRGRRRGGRRADPRTAGGENRRGHRPRRLTRLGNTFAIPGNRLIARVAGVSSLCPAAIRAAG